jgi:hypothetical protein
VGGTGWETSPPKLSLGENASFRLITDLGVRYEDNIFATAENQTGDTVISVSPGLEFRFGQSSQIHGSVLYQEAFTRYVDETAPNASLGTGRADFAYEHGRLSVAAGLSAQQRYQNSQAVAGLGQGAVTRSDVLNIHTSAETPLTAKTSFSVGANVSRTEYKTPGLIGSQDFTLPINMYFDVTPKVSLSTGFVYGKVKPQGGGKNARDWDYNIGARGNFTPKLSGHLSVGYSSRQVGDNPTENMLGFNGSFDYEMTPQINSTLVFSRDFGTGAEGSSLQTSSYSFQLSAALAPQWQLGTGITYRNVAYGAVVFASTNPLPASGRDDNYFEASVQATYQPVRWFNTSLEYTLSSNRSTLPGACYTTNVLNLVMGWQY